MNDRFRSHGDLLDVLADRSFDHPPALVCNAHVTGLGVARALSAHDIPVVAIDRNGDGVAPGSRAVEVAGQVTYPLDDLAGFRGDVEAIVEAIGQPVVAFPCMDEWVHAFAQSTPAGVKLPFADQDVIDRVLDKTSLYALAETLDVPYPETYRIEETVSEAGTPGPPLRSAEEASSNLEFPFVIKPALKRQFEEAIGTNVLEVADADEFNDVVALAAEEGITVMAQERVDVAIGEDRSVVSFVPPASVEASMSLVGNPQRYPPGFGTSCLVDPVEDERLQSRALAVLHEAGYHGISESEFVYDRNRQEYVLLDVNTRPWKWIGLPVAAGRNLPMAAYAAVTDATYELSPRDDVKWVYLLDYVKLVNGPDGIGDLLTRDEWLSIVDAAQSTTTRVVPGVLDLGDPEPMYQLLQTEFGDTEYYCSC